MSAYTPEGTFTYDDKIAFFNLRYELRVDGDDRAAMAELQGLERAYQMPNLNWTATAPIE